MGPSCAVRSKEGIAAVRMAERVLWMRRGVQFVGDSDIDPKRASGKSTSRHEGDFARGAYQVWGADHGQIIQTGLSRVIHSPSRTFLRVGDDPLKGSHLEASFL